MKRLDPSAFRVRQVLELLENAERPLTKFDVAQKLGIRITRAKSVLSEMYLAGRAKYIKIRRTRFYGPAK